MLWLGVAAGLYFIIVARSYSDALCSGSDSRPILNPFVDRLGKLKIAKRQMPRALAVTLVLVLLIAVIFAFF